MNSFISKINDPADVRFLVSMLEFGYGFLVFALISDQYLNLDGFWFQRSGAVLVLSALIAEYRIQLTPGKATVCSSIYPLLKTNALIHKKFSETTEGTVIKLISHFGVILGTLVWGYGDYFI